MCTVQKIRGSKVQCNTALVHQVQLGYFLMGSRPENNTVHWNVFNFTLLTSIYCTVHCMALCMTFNSVPDSEQQGELSLPQQSPLPSLIDQVQSKVPWVSLHLKQGAGVLGWKCWGVVVVETKVSQTNKWSWDQAIDVPNYVVHVYQSIDETI